ncbi:LAETG motif-containing sortase-dependent surface protein [Streptomyces sp. NPDC049040]|uniref:LAETG motif-containing sortase-dependent surface protein n=1 Tax=Streptomyces sp. NPDC049040 TaxID=3365593 RepID=UPI00371186E9
MRAITRRAIGVAAGLGSITAAITLCGIGTASAYAPAHNGGNDNCDRVGIEYKVAGGQWTKNGRINGDTPPTKISVRLTNTPGKNCEYNVSLASYSAEGPAWQNSGHQDFLGWDTATLSKSKTKATLDVSGNAPTCFGQVDLYGNGTKYDGGSDEGHGALPHYPDSATPTDLITAWNGGTKCEGTPTPTPTETSATPTPTETSATPTPTETSATPTPTDSTGTPSPSPSVSDTASPSPSTTAPTSTVAPTGTPSVPPASPSSGTGNLAETGSNSSQNAAFLGGGAALLVAGGAAVYFTRRRRNGAHS